MTPTQFRAAIDQLGLSQLGAARLVGADGRTARRWALGERQWVMCGEEMHCFSCDYFEPTEIWI